MPLFIGSNLHLPHDKDDNGGGENDGNEGWPKMSIVVKPVPLSSSHCCIVFALSEATDLNVPTGTRVQSLTVVGL